MGVEAVSDGSNHDASDEDHHAKRDSAAIAGKLCPAGGCGQLDFIDQGDVNRGSYRVLVVVSLLWSGWCSHGVLISFFWHCRIKENFC